MLPQPKWQNCLILDGDNLDIPFFLDLPYFSVPMTKKALITTKTINNICEAQQPKVQVSKPFYGPESQISVHRLGTEPLKLPISISSWLVIKYGKPLAGQNGLET